MEAIIKEDVYKNALENLKKIKDQLKEKEIIEFIKDPSNRSRYTDFVISLSELKKIGDSQLLKIKYAGVDFRNPVWIAASPISGVSNIDDAEKILENKLILLWELGAGAIIIKTTYLEVDLDKIKRRLFNYTPKDIKTENVNRVYSEEIGENCTLYNTGTTLVENLNPKKLIRVIRRIFERCKDISLIPSLGSHSFKSQVWEELFDVFIPINEIKVIEINARHVIRGLIEKSSKYFGKSVDFYPYIKDANEYLTNPLTGSIIGLWSLFKNWLNLINDLGIKHKKKLIIKLPFRSDINILCWICSDIYNINENKAYEEKGYKNFNESDYYKYGIKAVTLINTVKSPYLGKISKYDSIKIPQVSGQALKYLRDFSLFFINSSGFPLDISASGGIFNAIDILNCARLGAKSVQLCTVLLAKGIYMIPIIIRNLMNILKGREYEIIANEKKFIKDFKKSSLKIISQKTPSSSDKKCKKCGSCLETAYCDAILNRFTVLEQLKDDLRNISKIELEEPFIEPSYCTGCGMCVLKCEGKNKEKEAFLILKDTINTEIICSICSNNKAIRLPYLKENNVSLCNNCEMIINEDGSYNKELNRLKFYFNKLIATIIIQRASDDSFQIIRITYREIKPQVEEFVHKSRYRYTHRTVRTPVQAIKEYNSETETWQDLDLNKIMKKADHSLEYNLKVTELNQGKFIHLIYSTDKDIYHDDNLKLTSFCKATKMRVYIEKDLFNDLSECEISIIRDEESENGKELLIEKDNVNKDIHNQDEIGRFILNYFKNFYTIFPSTLKTEFYKIESGIFENGEYNEDAFIQDLKEDQKIQLHLKKKFLNKIILF